MLIDFLSNLDLCFFCRIVNCGACNASSYHLCKYGYGCISCVYNLLNILPLVRNVLYRFRLFSDSWKVYVGSSCFLDFGMVTFIFFAFLNICFFRPIPSYSKYLKTFQIELNFEIWINSSFCDNLLKIWNRFTYWYNRLCM